MNYATWVASISNLTTILSTDPNFQQILPECIDYAEQRMYRELDLLNTVTRDSSALTTGNRNYTLPQNIGRFVVTNGFNLITPSTTTNPDLGTRTPLTPVSRDFLDNVGGSPSYTGPPTNYAPITDQQFIVGPQWPDASYTIEVVGTIRPAPLSASNTTTYLTLYLPDAFVACSMVFMMGYERDFGAQSDNPESAQSWETQYGKLFTSANIEEQRKRYAAGGWGSLSPTPIATPSR